MIRAEEANLEGSLLICDVRKLVRGVFDLFEGGFISSFFKFVFSFVLETDNISKI